MFGELYVLLEYRGREMRLQYSDKPFALPANLYVIATMNTADRSTALVDLALRRRFHFVEFHPDRPPIEGLLGRWLERHAPGVSWVADVVDRANRKLNDRQAAIGPSYFMKDGLDEEMVGLIWEHNVLPLHRGAPVRGAEREALRRGLPSLGIEPAADAEHAWLLTPGDTAMGAFRVREAERFNFPDADTLVEGLARVFAASARRAVLTRPGPRISDGGGGAARGPRADPVRRSGASPVRGSDAGGGPV